MSKSKSKMDVKSIMAWAKSRWSLVAFAAIALLIVPAMVYFAMQMEASKHAAFEQQVKTDAADFLSPNIKYGVPALLPSAQPVEASHAPNEVWNKAFQDALNAQQASAAGVVTEAVDFNKGKGDRLHRPLVDGVFPNPPANDLVLAKQFRRVYVGDAMRALLEMVNAKEPISSAQLAQVLAEFQSNFLSRELGTDAKDGVARLPEDKQKQLAQEMVALRLSQYQFWGQKLSVYAGMSAFPNLPPVVESVTPTPVELWDWQVQYWTMQDVMRAIASANAPTRDIGVTRSVVKRIERLVVEPEAVASAGAIDPATGVAAPATANGEATPDYTKSITGRHANALYDVRTATLICVVDTDELPKFFNALSQSNLMTVTRVKLSKVDPVTEARDGYFYGDNHVTRAEISIETLWLREWTKDLMPKEVRVALGLESGDPAAAPAPDGSGAQPPANAPAPGGKRAGGAAGG